MHVLRQVRGPEPPRIVIVGAGASGLALASMLGGLAAHITVLEQDMEPARLRSFPGVLTTADFRALGIVPAAVRAMPVSAIRHASLGVAEPASSCQVSGWWLADHGALLQGLGDAVRERGVSIVSGATVTELTMRQNTVSGARCEARGRVYGADLVVLADESDPRLAERLGLRPDWLPTQLMHLGKERFPAMPADIRDRFSGHDRTWRIDAFTRRASWGAPGYGLVLPGPEAITVVVAMLLEDEMASSRHIREYLDEVSTLPAVRDAVSGLTPSSFFTEVVPVGGVEMRLPFHTDHLLVVNDLVGLTNPLNRDGFSANLAACLAAAETIREAVRERDFSASRLAAYTRQLTRDVIGSIDLKRRRDRSLHGRPAWQWASKPELSLPPGGEVLPAAADEGGDDRFWQRLRGFGRRPGVHRHAPGQYDE